MREARDPFRITAMTLQQWAKALLLFSTKQKNHIHSKIGSNHLLLQENQANPECSPQWCSFLLCPGHPSPLHLLAPLLAADPFPLSIVCLPRTHAKSTNGWWCGLFFVILVKRVECTFIMGVPFHEPAAEHSTTPNSFIHSSRLLRTFLIAFCGARGPNVSHGMSLIARERERERGTRAPGVDRDR